MDKSLKCNGNNDCVDGSDENLPECQITSLNTPPQYANIPSVPLCK